MSIFAPKSVVCTCNASAYIRVKPVMKKQIIIFFLILQGLGLAAQTIDYAAITMDKATPVADTTDLLVRDGDNYLKITADHLPATIVYMPDTAFGPLPVAAIAGGDTLSRSALFAGCQQQWRWQVPAAAQARIIDVAAHENARIRIEPYVCRPTASDTTAAVCGGLEWAGEYRSQSGDYTVTLVNAAGCDSVRTLHLTVYTPAANTDTIAEVWDSIRWYGALYTESGEYAVQKQDAHGCGYTHTLQLTVRHTSYEYIPEHACDSFFVNGVKYTAGGDIVRDTTYSDEGDRTVHIIRLTLGKTYYAPPTSVTTCYQYESMSGKIYTESGVYIDTVPSYGGCNAIITLNLTIQNCTYTDSVFFCPGEEETRTEKVEDTLFIHLPYTYQSPATWDYMQGAVLAGESQRTLLNLQMVEQNLRNHYVGRLTPVESVDWNVQYEGTDEYTPVVVENGGQWVDAGTLRMHVVFLCGEEYTGDYTTDIDRLDVREQAAKYIENGRVVILRGGQRYDILGTKIE